jgi:hypothetical protein
MQKAEIMFPARIGVIQVAMVDVTVQSAEEFLKLSYRQEEAVILRCAVPSLSHTSVIICSPLNHYFCALREYPVFARALNDYTAATLIPSDTFYKGLMAEARMNRIKKDTFPRGLFAPYAYWGAYGASMHGAIGKDFNSFTLQERVRSCFVPDAAVDRVIQHWINQLEAFGQDSFYVAKEELNQLLGSPGFSEVPDNSKIPYQSPDLYALTRNVFPNPEHEGLAMARLREIVSKLEQADRDVIKLFPLHMVKSSPSVYLNLAKHSFPGLAWERAILRSKVVRLLGWIWHYPSIATQLAGLKEKRLQFGDERDAVFGSIVSELETYLLEMEQKYPIILENPLNGSSSGQHCHG